MSRDKYLGASQLQSILQEEVVALLAECPLEEQPVATLGPDGRKIPYVILVVGVNGVGKTTTIAKLAHRFKQAGKKVCLGAADTFRAAAVEQLCLWGDRIGVPVVRQNMGCLEHQSG